MVMMVTQLASRAGRGAVPPLWRWVLPQLTPRRPHPIDHALAPKSGLPVVLLDRPSEG